jgi:hypothetical protein
VIATESSVSGSTAATRSGWKPATGTVRSP